MGEYTATIQVALADDHKIGSLEYMDRVRNRLATEFPDVRAFFQSGSLQDAILNSGMPAPSMCRSTPAISISLTTPPRPRQRIRRCLAWDRSTFRRT